MKKYIITTLGFVLLFSASAYAAPQIQKAVQKLPIWESGEGTKIYSVRPTSGFGDVENSTVCYVAEKLSSVSISCVK